MLWTSLIKSDIWNDNNDDVIFGLHNIKKALKARWVLQWRGVRMNDIVSQWTLTVIEQHKTQQTILDMIGTNPFRCVVIRILLTDMGFMDLSGFCGWLELRTFNHFLSFNSQINFDDVLIVNLCTRVNLNERQPMGAKGLHRRMHREVYISNCQYIMQARGSSYPRRLVSAGWITVTMMHDL